MSRWRLIVACPKGAENGVIFTPVKTENHDYFMQAERRRDNLHTFYPDCRITICPLQDGWQAEIKLINRRKRA